MPMFDVKEPSIVNRTHNKTEESQQISIFDAAKYFSCLNDNQQQEEEEREQCTKSIPPRLSSVSSSVETISSYRTRSFHATPTASSEVSWNSQAGLLANPPGLNGIRLVKSFSNNSNGSSRGMNKSNVSAIWPRISSKWLNRGRKCPCVGKKSVQVEESIDSKTLPKVVGLRRSTSSNGTISLYSPRKCSPNNLSIHVPSSTLPILPFDSKNPNISLGDENPIEKIESPHSNGGLSSLGLNSKPKVVSSSTLYDDLSKVNKGDDATSTDDATTITDADIATATSSVFTFPILENPLIGLNKMFNVIPPSHQTNEGSHRESIEVFQPTTHPSPKSRRTSYEDENVSDGSSDLFEIESFSTTTYPYRDSIDEVTIPSSNFDSSTIKRLGIICPSYNNQVNEEHTTQSIGSNECYVPSEMNINWWSNNNTKESGKNSSEGLLLGCRNEKMVSVGPSPIKFLGQEGPQDVARHVRGGPQVVRAAHVNESGKTKARLVVGRSLSTILSMPFSI